MPTNDNASLTQPKVNIAPTRAEMGAHAARGAANELRSRLRVQQSVRMIFAAAPSQSEMLAALCAEPNIDWSRVTAFHMDEYIGLAVDAPQRFGNWLRHAIFDRLPFAATHLLDPGNDPAQAALEYATQLNAAPIDIVCCGIGTNGHLAFNDPPADFNDPVTVKQVELDHKCRQQQVDDRCFATLNDVPMHALTITIPALLAARAIFCTVPGPQKRDAVRHALRGPIDPACPASILRRHARCTFYLDQGSASGLA